MKRYVFCSTQSYNTYYHVTAKDNLKSILAIGLTPSIGDNSSEFGENIERVYLFRSITDVQDALYNWLGDLFDEDEDVCLLQIDLPSSFPIIDGDVGYESYSYETIPPKYITYMYDV